MKVWDSGDASLRFLQGLPDLPQPEPLHTAQVTSLALDLFDALAEPLQLDADGRDLLAAAAHWHDAGHAIADKGHHKHSYRLIMEAPISCLSTVEQKTIACIARYHRKALPDDRHEGYGELSLPAREGVRRLAAVLRIADGLDYSHRSLVRIVGAEVSRSTMKLIIQAPEEATLELRRAELKADLFREVFARDVVIRREP